MHKASFGRESAHFAIHDGKHDDENVLFFNDDDESDDRNDDENDAKNDGENDDKHDDKNDDENDDKHDDESDDTHDDKSDDTNDDDDEHDDKHDDDDADQVASLDPWIFQFFHCFSCSWFSCFWPELKKIKNRSLGLCMVFIVSMNWPELKQMKKMRNKS